MSQIEIEVGGAEASTFERSGVLLGVLDEGFDLIVNAGEITGTAQGIIERPLAELVNALVGFTTTETCVPTEVALDAKRGQGIAGAETSCGGLLDYILDQRRHVDLEINRAGRLTAGYPFDRLIDCGFVGFKDADLSLLLVDLFQHGIGISAGQPLIPNTVAQFQDLLGEREISASISSTRPLNASFRIFSLRLAKPSSVRSLSAASCCLFSSHSRSNFFRVASQFTFCFLVSVLLQLRELGDIELLYFAESAFVLGPSGLFLKQLERRGDFSLLIFQDDLGRFIVGRRGVLDLRQEQVVELGHTGVEAFECLWRSRCRRSPATSTCL